MMPMVAVMISDVVSRSMELGTRSVTISKTRLLPLKLRSVRASPRSRVKTRNTVRGRR